MREQKNLIVLALGLFSVAVGMDYLEGLKAPVFADIASTLHVHRASVIHFSKALEEVIEMFATSIFLVSFLTYFFDRYRSVRMSILYEKHQV